MADGTLEQEQDKEVGSFSLLKFLEKSGPYGFGGLMVIALFKFILEPLNETQKLNFQALNDSIIAMQKVSADQQKLSAEQLEITRQLKDAAVGLERAAIEFNRNK